jgi:hypothetical protein
MNTTDNDQQPVDQTSPDGQITQEEIDRQEHDKIVKAETAYPISESQVEPGREAVDGNGQRDFPEKELVRTDVIVDENADTQAAQERHAKEVQDKENAKLNTNSKPGTAPVDKKSK